MPPGETPAFLAGQNGVEVDLEEQVPQLLGQMITRLYEPDGDNLSLQPAR